MTKRKIQKVDKEVMQSIDSASEELMEYIETVTTDNYIVDVTLSVAIYFLEKAKEIDKEKTYKIISAYYAK